MNLLHLPRIKKKDVLFISGVDAALLTKNNKLTPYSKVELNRLIDSGANFTISTGRTPATLMESIEGIHLKLPVIVMDGAAIYDINANAYLVTDAMSSEQSRRMAELLDENNLSYFSNVIIDDLLVIFYEALENKAGQDIVKRLGRSPYRNYVKRRLPEQEEEYRFVISESEDDPDYVYMKIYRKDVNREHMRQKLLEMLHLETSIMFGSVAGACDVLIKDSDKNEMVKQLKRAFEPVGIHFGKD